MYRNWFASLLFAVSLPLAACQGTGSTGSGTLAIQGQGCQVSSQCLPGLECEVEHGVGTCQPHGHKGNADGGQVEDKHDGGDDNGGGGNGGMGACQVDADCAKGEECEVEHGVGTCKAHEGEEDGVDGGDDKGGDDNGGDDKGVDGGDGGDDKGGGGGGGGNGGGGNGGGGNGGGGADGGVSCKVDADCAKGQRCKVEHGVGTCEDHG